MRKSIQSELVVFLLCLFRTGHGEGGSKIKIPLKRTYRMPQVAVVNDPTGLQYYAAGPLYTIPTVLIPNQIGISATPITNVVLPPLSDPKPAQEFQETSTPVYQSQKPVKLSNHFYKQKHRSHAYVPNSSKRPTTYVNSVYGHPVRMKPLPSIPLHKGKGSSLSIQPSVDLSGQFAQESASNLYPTTVGPPVVSTYGPPKAVDVQYNTRLAGIGGYHKLKGPSHRIYYHPSKKMRVYTHVHKDHIHNHYIPSSFTTYPTYKPQQPAKYSAPAYLPPAPSTPPTFIQETTSGYQTNGHVKFPDNQETVQPSKDQTDSHKPSYTPGDVTQAIIKSPGVINNYDANIPLHVPSKKPYQFEVNEILKNAELHFVQEAAVTGSNPQQTSDQNGELLQYPQKVPYQSALVFGTHQPFYTPLMMSQSNVIGSPQDIYNIPGVNAYQTNHIADQDLGTSETVKVPVAVIRGAHNIASQGMFGFTVKRQDEPTSPGGEIKKAFTPSKRTSDWIPMSGNGVPLVTQDNAAEKHSDASLETFEEEYYSPTNQSPKSSSRQQVGDIISGKIPEKFSPKAGRDGDVVSGKINFFRNSPEREKRKGSVIDVYPSANSEVINPGDTSDLVVSSVIKFS